VGAIKISAAVIGTAGGVVAVLAYAPPQHNATLSSPSQSPIPSETPSQSNSPTDTPTPTPSATTSPTKTPVAIKSQPNRPKKSISTPKQPVNGTFTGAVSETPYGNVQVQIDVVNGTIVGARAVQLPSNPPNQPDFNSKVAQYLVTETIKSSLDNFHGVGGASTTSQGWYDSLYSAVSRAGL
jgi:uncharacterized protein with FMN-binding domain